MLTHRFGRKIPLPSTCELKHEFRMIEAAEAIASASSGADVKIVIDELARLYGLSQAQAQSLLLRFGAISDGVDGKSGSVTNHPTSAPLMSVRADDGAADAARVDHGARATGAIHKMDQDISDDSQKL
jgi:hypothetical protein